MISPSPGQPSRWSLLGRLAIATFLFAPVTACSPDDAGESCVDQLCDPATFATACHGNSLWQCAADGRSYTFTACNAQERCDASSSPARCSIRVCTTPGVSTCLNAVERETCSLDGGERIRETCPSGSACRDGACVPNDCTTGEDTCTTNGFLRCVQAQWQSTTCPTGQVCQMSGGVPACGEKRCTPLASRCQDRKVYTCDALGATETETPCGDGETCVEGICQPPVCGATPTTDVTTPDTVDGPTEIRFAINGTVRVLDLNVQGVFTESGRRMTISATRNNRRLEIRLAPTTRLVTGGWDSEIFSPTLVSFCYTDGASGDGVGECEAPFTHHESAYKVTITRNDGVGGRIEGTFEATLEDVNRDPMILSGGSFSVLQR